MAQDEDNDWKQQKSNKILAKGRQHAFNLRHGFLKSKNHIGGYYKYDHKISFAAGTLLSSLSVVLQESIFSYLYFLFFIKILKDTFASTIKDGKLFQSTVVSKPLLYYLAAGSIIVVAAHSTQTTIPAFQSGLTYYLGV